MTSKIFTPEQVDQFISRGHVTLKGALPREQALAAQDFLWQRVAERGVQREDQSTWTEPMVHIKESYKEPAFPHIDIELVSDAVEELVGQGRWRERGQTPYWGWWPVNFALGADSPWTVPSRGWHWDGIQFRHTVDAPDQGLLMLCLFSEIGPRGGGTVVAEGSHQVVARFLNQHAEGIELVDAIKLCNEQHPWLAELTGTDAATEEPAERIARFMDTETVDGHGTKLRVVETTGSPGDVIFCHPFLYHAAAQNHSGVPRFMCNRTTPLYKKLQLQRDDNEYSPVERSIRGALQLQ
jgi:ectoine hydroxylase-related dioxygenase (phytanoyl-CoA dioxygenase family)